MAVRLLRPDRVRGEPRVGYPAGLQEAEEVLRDRTLGLAGHQLEVHLQRGPVGGGDDMRQGGAGDPPDRRGWRTIQGTVPVRRAT